MCGIVGYIGNDSALEVIISGLEKLEYRGYDSAGVAIYHDGTVRVARAQGKLKALKDLLKTREDLTPEGGVGIGHTRWATHGAPSENNAHPHTAGRISLIHNGIIENYIELRERLQKDGCEFLSETDTEIAAQLLNQFVEKGMEPFDALRATCKEVRGSYAFLAIDSENPDRILVAKNATPIVIGIGDGETYIASDIPAILQSTRDVVILEDGDLVEVTAEGVQRIENCGEPIDRPVQKITWDPVTAQKGGYKHYMLKEVHEQVEVSAETFRGRIGLEKGIVSLPEIELTDAEVESIDRVVMVACGTAWHACLVAKFYIEKFTGIPAEVDYASEFRYRATVLNERTLVVVVSQSGETADTLAAVQHAKNNGSPTLAICNVVGSSIARKVDNVVYTHAGPEISVASTKAFTTQVISLYLFSMYLGQRRGSIQADEERCSIDDLVHLPSAIDKVLKVAGKIEAIAKKYHSAQDFLFIGRGSCYPIALEGALKLKEIPYIHAEGYPAGELKHGPIALIDEKMPVVVVIQKEQLLFEKTLSNLREVESRGGRIIAVTDEIGHKELAAVSEDLIEVPFINNDLTPLVLTIPLQLLAYYVAVFNGTDVDLPRNLAKSVTVE